jgi:hypothetical protein
LGRLRGGRRPAADRARGLSNTRLKVVGLVLVLLSAGATATVMKGLPANISEADFGALTAAVALEGVGWIALPIYAWLLYAGFQHTHSIKDYALRLGALALISEVPYDLATFGRPWDMSSQNPVFALLVALLVLAYLRGIANRPPGDRAVLTLVVLATSIVALLMFNVALRLAVMPCGVLLLAFTLVFYYMHERENAMMLVGAGIGALALVFPAFGFVILHFRNGRQTLNTAPGRRVFYILYPAGLLAAAVWRALAP